VRLPKNIRETGAAKVAHDDLAEAKSTSSFRGTRFVGGDTNKLTPEFKAFLASRRVGRKKAEKALKVVVQHTAHKAVEGSNDVSLRDLNRSVPGPKAPSYVKPKSEAPTREQIEYSNRELERAYRRKLEASRPHTSEYTRGQKFEYENRRIREKKKNRNAKERPEGRVIRVKKSSGRAWTRVESVQVSENKVVPPTKEELMSRGDADIELLGLAGLSCVERKNPTDQIPVGDAGVNDREQELWGL